MAFITAHIDRAIVATQYDLRGFDHPLGFRLEAKCPKMLYCLTGNLVGWAVGYGSPDKPVVPEESYAPYRRSKYDEYLAMCKKLAASCDRFQREAIQLLILEIVKQSEEMKAEVAAGARETDPYLYPLEKDNAWGKAVLALAAAFEVNLEAVPT